MSDKVITQKSGFLKYIQQGDVVMADRGFNIHDDLAIQGAYLKIPAFTKGNGTTVAERGGNIKTISTSTNSRRTRYWTVTKKVQDTLRHSCHLLD